MGIIKYLFGKRPAEEGLQRAGEKHDEYVPIQIKSKVRDPSVTSEQVRRQ